MSYRTHTLADEKEFIDKIGTWSPLSQPGQRNELLRKYAKALETREFRRPQDKIELLIYVQKRMV